MESPPKPEHIKSEALKYPAPYPEDLKYIIAPAVWDELVGKYGEEKVKLYYRKNEKLPEFTASVHVTLPKPEFK